MSGFQIWALHVKMQRNGCQKTVKKVTMKWLCALGKEAADGGSSQPRVFLHEQEWPWEYNGLPVPQGKAGTMMPCWTAAISPAYGNTHREGVTKFKPIMWITFQALLSPRVLSNTFEVSRSAVYLLNCKATEKGQVSTCTKARIEQSSMHVPCLLREHQLQWCHGCWRGTVKE